MDLSADASFEGEDLNLPRPCQIASELRPAVALLSSVGLKLAARWGAELLVAASQAAAAQGADDADVASKAAAPAVPAALAGSQNEGDKLTLAKTFFDCGEYRRAASVLAPPSGPHRRPAEEEARSRPRSLFLRCYARYLAGEKRKGEEKLERADALERCHVTNRELESLLNVLLPLYEGRHLDGLGLYMLGIVLKQQQQVLAPLLSSGGGGDGDGGDGDDEMRAQGPLQGLRAVRSVSAREVLVQAVTALPWNWSAWLELAELVALPDAPGIGSGSTSADSGAGAAGTAGAAMRALDSIASCSTGAGGWMSTFFRAHVLLELDAERGTRSGAGSALSLYRALHDALGGHSGYVRQQIATAQYNMRLFDEAQQEFEELRRLDPHRLEALDVYSNILYVKEEKAQLSHLAHDAVQSDKFRSETCCIVGNYYSLKQQHERAVLYFQRALRLNPRFLSAWTLMGHEYVEMKNVKAAVEAYRRAVDINPRDFRAWYGLGQTYELLNMSTYSLHYYRKATTLRPYDARMWCAMANCFSRIGRRRDAIRAYERALPSDQDGGLHYQLAKLYMQEADRAKAAEHFKQHIAEHAPEHEGPNDNSQTQEAREFLAHWYKEQRQFAEAIRQVQQLQQGIPGRPKDNADALMAEILADQARAAAAGER